jgi:hypothetical protein
VFSANMVVREQLGLILQASVSIEADALAGIEVSPIQWSSVLNVRGMNMLTGTQLVRANTFTWSHSP